MRRALGLVLAGGRSTRFGSEKAMAEVGGQPMVAQVAAVLACGCVEVAINAPAASGAAAWARNRGLPVLPDPPGLPDGPLSGVVAGLAWAEAHGAHLLVTAPCDTPHLPHDHVRRLLAGLGDAPAAFATTTAGSQPLSAAWRAGVLSDLRETLALGHPSVRTWLAGVGAVGVHFEDADGFHNLNTPSQVTSRPARRI